MSGTPLNLWISIWDFFFKVLRRLRVLNDFEKTWCRCIWSYSKIVMQITTSKLIWCFDYSEFIRNISHPILSFKYEKKLNTCYFNKREKKHRELRDRPRWIEFLLRSLCSRGKIIKGPQAYHLSYGDEFLEFLFIWEVTHEVYFFSM